MAGAVTLGAVSCGSSGDGKDSAAADIVAAGSGFSFQKTSDKPSAGFNSAAADFSAELFKKICSEDIGSGKNACVSPQSVMLALGLAANGAGGDTLTQFEQVLGKGMKTEDINKGLAAQISKAKSTSEVKYDIANSIWVREGDQITLKKSYAELCKERFDAESYLAPFNNDTVTEINNWVKDHTGGMIDKIKENFDPNEVAVLLNAIAFDAKWESPYDEFDVKDGRFTAADGKEQTCKMMHGTESVFLLDSNAKGFLKYYQGGQYAFMAMLPDEGVSLSDYVSGLTGEKLLSLYNGRSEKSRIITSMPKFSFDWGDSIADGVKAMGLEKAFDSKADFSNMAETASGELFISNIIHKTHIDVDTEGTKAGAVTEVLMTEGAVMVEDETLEVTLDRPFVFAIVDTETGLPIFMGAVNTLES